MIVYTSVEKWAAAHDKQASVRKAVNERVKSYRLYYDMEEAVDLAIEEVVLITGLTEAAVWEMAR